MTFFAVAKIFARSIDGVQRTITSGESCLSRASVSASFTSSTCMTGASYPAEAQGRPLARKQPSTSLVLRESRSSAPYHNSFSIAPERTAATMRLKRPSVFTRGFVMTMSSTPPPVARWSAFANARCCSPGKMMHTMPILFSSFHSSIVRCPCGHVFYNCRMKDREHEEWLANRNARLAGAKKNAKKPPGLKKKGDEAKAEKPADDTVDRVWWRGET